MIILGVVDALGVDWSSLVAETRQPMKEISTTAKQKWQTHRIFLDIGISMCLAGEAYAKHLLNESQQKLDKELKEQQENGEESMAIDRQESGKSDAEHNNKDVKSEPLEETNPENAINEENSKNQILKMVTELNPLACVQVAQRKCQQRRQQLIGNICGPSSRALSARQDLKLRRQLCDLTTNDLGLMSAIPVASDKIKSMAMLAFRKSNEIKVI